MGLFVHDLLLADFSAGFKLDLKKYLTIWSYSIIRISCQININLNILKQ